MPGAVEFNVEWPGAPPETGHPLLDSSLGQLSIGVGDESATRHRTQHGMEGDRLYIPTYHIAEWIASNWWSLLYETPKTEDFQNDFDFRERHWLGTARNGFALPDLWFCPAGGKIEVTGYAAELAFARLRFLLEISDVTETGTLAQTFRHFVEQVLDRLRSQGIAANALNESWELVSQTADDMKQYCRLIGALGLSPYDEHQGIDDILDAASDRLPPDILRDLCEAADERTLDTLANLTTGVFETLAGAKEINLADLLAVPLPADAFRHAWQRGREAAGRVRGNFHISNGDPEGSKHFFEKLDLDPRILALGDGPSQIGGVLQKGETTMHLAVLDKREPQQRFAAARGAFLGWAGDIEGSRLVSTAITRDQQASRAFAAELLAPIGYIRTKARNGLLSEQGVQDIADSLCAPAGAVRYQARHGGIHVAQGSFL